MEIPFGYCHCGCGNKTNLAVRTSERLGYVKGEPMKYLVGHHWLAKTRGTVVPPNPSGECQCGCGKTTPKANFTSYQTGNVKGHHKRFCVGHGTSFAHRVSPQNVEGLCMCGCGKPTKISPFTRSERGYAAGQPMNFIHNHHSKRPDYIEECRGYKTPCWIWQKWKNRDGYGATTLNRKPMPAHRAYYTQFRGEIPLGYQVDHLCSVTSCVNPDHLEAILPIENSRRRRTTKLTVELVRQIGPLKESGMSYGQIADRFGVTVMAVYNAHIGRTWKGVPAI